MKAIIGKKVGMTQIFDENGYVVKEKAVEPINPFVSKKYPETDSASLNDIINQSS